MENALRIAVLTETVEWGGAEKFAAELASLLVRRGHDVAIVNFGDPVFTPDRVNPSVAVVQFRLPAPVGLLESKAIKAVLADVRADVGIFVKGWSLAGSWRFDIAARRKWKRYIVIEQAACEPMPPRARDSPDGSRGESLLRWWKIWFGRSIRAYLAHKTVAVSGLVADRLRSQYWYPPSRIMTAPNGADTGVFFASSDRRSAARRSFGYSDDMFVFGVVCRLAPIKRVDRVIRAFAELQPATPFTRLVVVGQGVEEPALRRLVTDLGLQGVVQFFPFTRSPELVYPGIDSLVLASENEGLPLSVCEAMASEVIPIVSDVGGNRDLVSSADVGFLVPRGDHARLVEAMKTVTTWTMPERQRIGRAARERVVRLFSLKDQIESVAALVNPRPSARR